MTKQFVLEWSQSTGMFRTKSLESMCAKNQKHFIEDEPHDGYIVLMVAEESAIQAMRKSWSSRVGKTNWLRLVSGK